MRHGDAAPVGIFAIVLLLISGSSFFSNMASVFDQAYHVEGRNAVVERLIGLLMLAVTATLLVLSTTAAGLAGLVSNVPGILPIGPLLGQVVGWSVSIVSVIVLFWLIYRVLPNASQTWRSVLPGALLAAALVLLVTQVFPLYVALFPPNHAYAVFGVFLVLTFWLYILGIILVLGAQLNAFLEQPARSAALAEATAAAQHGRAEYQQDSGSVKAEASGDAPALRGPGPLGAPSRSANEQLAAEQSGSQHVADPDHNSGGSQPRVGVGGRLVGLIGLVVAAVLLRGSIKSEDPHLKVQGEPIAS